MIEIIVINIFNKYIYKSFIALNAFFVINIFIFIFINRIYKSFIALNVITKKEIFPSKSLAVIDCGYSLG
jgi:hypothetical protein